MSESQRPEGAMVTVPREAIAQIVFERFSPNKDWKCWADCGVLGRPTYLEAADSILSMIAAIQQSPISGGGAELAGWQRRMRNIMAAPNHPWFQWSSWTDCDERQRDECLSSGGLIEGFPELRTEVRPVFAAPPVPSVSDQGSSLRDTHRVAETAVVGDPIVTSGAAPLTKGCASPDDCFITGPVWKEPELTDEDGGEIWTSEVQVIGGWSVVATVHGADEAEAASRAEVLCRALNAPSVLGGEDQGSNRKGDLPTEQAAPPVVGWKCNCCTTRFVSEWTARVPNGFDEHGTGPSCPRCKAGGAYTYPYGLHQSDPCVHCGVGHDDVAPGECPGPQPADGSSSNEGAA